MKNSAIRRWHSLSHCGNGRVPLARRINAAVAAPSSGEAIFMKLPIYRSMRLQADYSEGIGGGSLAGRVVARSGHAEHRSRKQFV
jgi:hypothetical protein